jgi:hypothetical protein
MRFWLMYGRMVVIAASVYGQDRVGQPSQRIWRGQGE